MTQRNVIGDSEMLPKLVCMSHLRPSISSRWGNAVTGGGNIGHYIITRDARDGHKASYRIALMDRYVSITEYDE